MYSTEAFWAWPTCIILRGLAASFDLWVNNLWSSTADRKHLIPLKRSPLSLTCWCGGRNTPPNAGRRIRHDLQLHTAWGRRKMAMTDGHRFTGLRGQSRSARTFGSITTMEESLSVCVCVFVRARRKSALEAVKQVISIIRQMDSREYTTHPHTHAQYCRVCKAQICCFCIN